FLGGRSNFRAYPASSPLELASSGTRARGTGPKRYTMGGRRGAASRLVLGGEGALLGAESTALGAVFRSQLSGTSFAARLIGGAAIVSACSPHMGTLVNADARDETQNVSAMIQTHKPMRRAKSATNQLVKDQCIMGRARQSNPVAAQLNENPAAGIPELSTDE
ncbi:MAG TPA: hypothetical protein VFQ35_16730, partial [Polyangiaceae bacterium]|nr:hypothetical protein [Polyangiaceae bacterium]